MEPSYAKIFPPIGIARVGDSPDGWYIGPEWPGQLALPDDYRDESGRLKRQGARFRIYTFSADDKVIGEVTRAEATIEWSVRLANKKAAWFPFQNGNLALKWFELEAKIGTAALIADPLQYQLPYPRNPSVGLGTGDDGKPRWDYQARRKLEISGDAAITAKGGDDGLPAISAISGEFNGKTVALGNLCVDAHGRLIVLGGFGHSEATGLNGADTWIRSYANNDGWFDDVSDGPVTAKVTLTNGRELPVRGGAWVIATPPDFAPATNNLVTAYEVIDEISDHYKVPRPPELPANSHEHVQFWRDVFPIILRLDGYSWVSDIGLRGHGFGKPGAMTGDSLPKLADPDDPQGRAVRATIGRIIRKPFEWYPEDVASKADWEIALSQANHRYMPPISGDEGDTTDGLPKTWLTVSPRQFAILQSWAQNKFAEGNPPNASPGEAEPQRFALEEIPAALTRGALDPCAGGAFYPGIEITAIAKSPRLYSEAFRIDHGRMTAGDITKWMACPWQADFWECQLHWWPGQRPDSVVTSADFDATLDNFPNEKADGKLPATLFPRSDWARGIGTARPALSALVNDLVAIPTVAETVDAKMRGFDIEKYADAIEYRIRRVWGAQVLPSASYPVLSQPDGSVPEYADRLPSPWRLQYLLQEATDGYSGRFFFYHVPRPEQMSLSGLPDSTAWRSYCRAHTKEAADLLDDYRTAVIGDFSKSVRNIILSALGTDLSPDHCQSILKLTPPIDRDAPDQMAIELAFGELVNATADAWYLFKSIKSGDMDMVEYWSRQGVVVPRKIVGTQGTSTAYVETARDPYDGLSYAEYFHILQNPDDYPGVPQLANLLADRILERAEQLIKDIQASDQMFVETAFPYSPELFEAKMEEVYEYYRNQAQVYKAWEVDATRDERVARILYLAPFNQLDGAWLRFTADAGESDAIHGLLFQIWRDEVGNGNPAEHHGNLYTSLLRSLGYALPDTSELAYIEQYPYTDDAFVSPMFELAVSAHSRKYLPEILGMTLYLEWEVLDLVPGVRLWDYLGIDAKFLRMHVGIDNAADGHGAKAKAAVHEYLEQIAKEGGEEAVQQHWKRIWRGFVAFAAPMDNYLPDEYAVFLRRPKSVEQRLTDLIARKRPYASRNHSEKRLGTDRINDLFEYPGELLAELAASQWVVPGEPQNSKLLTYLTTYDGPMYKVFNDGELELWAEWIRWLGKSGDTSYPKEIIGIADAMLRLLELMRSGGLASSGHARFRISGKTLADWFAEPDLSSLMRALRDDQSGWVVAGNAGASGLVLDQLRADRAMGRALDRRFPELQNRIGRLVIVSWINANCPIPGEKIKPTRVARRVMPGELKPLRQSLVHAFGQGSVH